jgi:hypothetical protein
MTATAANVELKRRQVARMRAAGLRVVEVDGWQQRGRPQTYAPISVMEHHDASSTRSGNAGALPIIVNGRPGIPGPLSQWQVGRDGTWFLVAAGRANHAGAGGPILGIPKDSGNRYCEGVDEPYSPRLHASLDLGLACLLAEIRRSTAQKIADWLLLHKTWAPGRKTDPRHARSWRQGRIKDLLARWVTKTPPTPAPAHAHSLPAQTVQEDDMARRVKKKNDPQQWLIAPGVAKPLSQAAVNGYVKLGILPNEPVEELPDEQVDALIELGS